MARIIHNKEIEWRGAITEDGRAWVIWDHHWRDRQLKIQRIVTLSPVTDDERAAYTTALLQKALEEASAWNLPKVLIWNPDEATTLGIKGVSNAHEHDVKLVFEERLESSLPSLRWRGGRSVRDVVWEDNHYYAWC